MTELDFEHRLVRAWEASGRHPTAAAHDGIWSVRRCFSSSHPNLLDLAEDLLATSEVYVHGIFNARPKAPTRSGLTTPWHQDAQYFRDAENVHVPTMWIPLQAVTEKNSCLQVAAGRHRIYCTRVMTIRKQKFLGLTPEAQVR